MLFRLRKKVGNHVERDENGKPMIYKSGDVVESKQDLVRLFSGKFDRVDGGGIGTAVQAVPNIPMPSKGADLEKLASLQQPTKPLPTTPPVPPTTPLESTDKGVDVTDSFTNIKKLGVRIFKQTDGWYILKINDDPRNDVRIRKNEVQEYLNKMK